jgi:threonylcarbamoyladenosine tRNA methylthiotransferase MtaB
MRLGVYFNELKMGNGLENKRVTVALETLGCKLNQAETELLARRLAGAGCRIVSAEDKADIYILNTCTVTHIADSKSRHLLRMAHRRNPGAYIIALGCYAERGEAELAGIEGVSLIVGNAAKINLPELLERAGRLKLTGDKAGTGEHRRTRSFVKAQDGCNHFCTYCIVPVVRSREKSLSPEQVISEIRQRVVEGYQEVVLTGTEIGRYYRDNLDLKGLLERVMAETGIRRLRLSSLQPPEIQPELVRLWQNPRLCRHFHISLQSGSGSVIRRMGRPYTPEEYSRTVDFLRSSIPDVAITTDVIVGFPGETQEEFDESYAFCRRMAFSRVHVFPYSPREGTRAAQMADQVKPEVKKERSRKMLSLARTSLEGYHRRFLGRTAEVLFEGFSGGLWTGYSDTYIKVSVKGPVDLTNQFRPVRLLELKGEGMRGEISG